MKSKETKVRVSGIPMGILLLLARGAASSYGRLTDYTLGGFTIVCPDRETAEKYISVHTFGHAEIVRGK